MSWLQLELSVIATQVDVLEDLLLASGAVAITLVSDQHEPVLEPNPGETPLWDVIRLHALFEADTDISPLLEVLGDRKFSWEVQYIGAQDWQQHARTFAVDRVFADPLRLRPPLAADEIAPPSPAHGATLYLEPGLAFGSGSHPTTRLCLTWLAENVRPGMQVLDFGCGSGILAIAAVLLGAQCDAVDHDDQAVLATRENADMNAVAAGQLEVCNLAQWQTRKVRQYDVVVANILAGPLISLAGEFQSVMGTGAAIVLSGVLAEQAEEVMAAYPHIQFDPPMVEDGWACLHGIYSE